MTETPRQTAIIVLSPRTMETAQRAQVALPGALIHGLRSRVPDADVKFDDAMEHIRALFSDGSTIVGLCAAGILIRSLAPRLADKRTEPPVLALSESGSHIVPLLGGHHGANRLAHTLATALGGTLAITTAGENALGFALDDPPAGWRLSPGSDVKGVTAALLAGEPVALESEAADAEWLHSEGAQFTDEAPQRILITDRAGGSADVILHPAVLAVGVGCERGAATDEVIRLIGEALEETGLSALSVARLVSIDLKLDEPAIQSAAAHFGVSARFFDVETLEAETPRLATPSETVFRAVGSHGVAEAAALAAVGSEGTLVATKRKSAHATCAIARAPDVIRPEALGRGRGQLSIVGLGPGRAAWRTPDATAAVATARDVVGYAGYLDLLGPLAEGKALHGFDLGEEEARARLALDLAAEGRSVALVSSGDAGIYGMAALIFELLERDDQASWRTVDVLIEPGLSALQAAAARAGAPLGHDFCAISLSDLLTPREAIERRLQAAAEVDFVVALYNPASRTRRALLSRAIEILAAHRPATCPITVARALGRPDEAVVLTTLEAFDADAVDMLTTVIVGSSATRLVEGGNGQRWAYTPRGYDVRDGTKPAESAESRRRSAQRALRR